MSNWNIDLDPNYLHVFVIDLRLNHQVDEQATRSCKHAKESAIIEGGKEIKRRTVQRIC